MSVLDKLADLRRERTCPVCDSPYCCDRSDEVREQLIAAVAALRAHLLGYKVRDARGSASSAIDIAAAYVSDDAARGVVAKIDRSAIIATDKIITEAAPMLKEAKL